jgi:hypothetical protein
MTQPTLQAYQERIVKCKEKLLHYSPAGHPKVDVLDSFLSRIEAYGRFTSSQISYLGAIEEIADRLQALSGGWKQFNEEGIYKGWTRESLTKALDTALQLCDSYNANSYYWRRHRTTLDCMHILLRDGCEISLKQWDTIHKLKGFDNLADAYAQGQKFASGDLVQLRASIISSNIVFDGHGVWSKRNQLYNNRRETVATVIEYDARPPFRLVQTDKNGSCRVVKILPIGSIEPVYITEKDLKKVPSKVIAGGAQ